MQKDHSNRMRCLYRKVASSITFTMHHDVGHLSDGIKLVRLPVKIVACKCVALLCCYHVAFHCFRASNSYAVQNISKVSEHIFSLFFFRRIHSMIFRLCFYKKKWWFALSEKKGQILSMAWQIRRNANPYISHNACWHQFMTLVKMRLRQALYELYSLNDHVRTTSDGKKNASGKKTNDVEHIQRESFIMWWGCICANGIYSDENMQQR